MPEKDHYSYNMRNPSLEVQEAIAKKFAGQPERGQNSPRQAWLRAIVNISALEPAIGADAARDAYSLWISAIQIAQARGEIWLRDSTSLYEKYTREIGEFTQELMTRQEIMNRLASIIYYATQIYSQDGGISIYIQRCEAASQRAGIPLHIARRIARAKFESRGRHATLGQSKNVQEEEHDMQRVLDEYSTETSFQQIHETR